MALQISGVTVVDNTRIGTLQGLSVNANSTNFNNGTTVNFNKLAGTAPFTVDSTTVVTNLNADLLDGVQGANYLRSNIADTFSSLTGGSNLGSTTVTTQNLTSGATATPGTVVGQWTLQAGTTWQATFADLAEWYRSDFEYESGHVLIFGGDFEVTESTIANDTRVAGIVTTNPAFIMNVDLPEGPDSCIALQGKVPCKVIGQVAKGDLLVASGTAGHAIVNNGAAPYTVIGKALENKATEEAGLINVSVGR